MSVPLPGPFRVSGTVWRSKPRRRGHRSRFARPLYWLSGLVVLEGVLWMMAGELLGLWWLLWWAARGATIAMQAMWTHSQPVGSAEPDWQSALDNARPPWPKRQAAKAVAA